MGFRKAFDATDFWWINLYVIYNDVQAVEMDMDDIKNINPSAVILVINDQQVMINANSIGTDKHSFTDRKKGYNKLPKGTNVTLVAIGYYKSHLMFGMKKIIIRNNKSENFDLKSATLDELEKNLKKLN